MLQYILIETAIDLVFLVACIGVFYYRRDVLIPLFRFNLKRFLGISDHEQRLGYLESKSALHSKRLNKHLRRLNGLDRRSRYHDGIEYDDDSDTGYGGNITTGGASE